MRARRLHSTPSADASSSRSSPRPGTCRCGSHNEPSSICRTAPNRMDVSGVYEFILVQHATLCRCSLLVLLANETARLGGAIDGVRHRARLPDRECYCEPMGRT